MLSTRSLPLDVISDILTWVPLESLETCRQVCRAWRTLTYESSFIALHCVRTRTLTGYFLQSMYHNNHYSTFLSYCQTVDVVPSLNFMPKKTRIWSSTHRGLVCCQIPHAHYDYTPRLCVCKPATQQWRPIPTGTNFDTQKIAIYACPEGALRFKIIKLSEPRYTNKSRSTMGIMCEIFNSADWRWKRLKKLLPPLLLKREPGEEVNNVVYWLVFDQPVMLAFDVENEIWRLIPLPPPYKLPQVGAREEVRCVNEKLVAACGQLWLIRNERFLSDDDIDEMWVMIDQSRGRWEKVRHERLMRLKGKDSVGHLFTHKVALSTDIWRIGWIDLQRGEVKRVPINHMWPTEIFKFESDLEPCNLLDAG